MGKRFDVWLVAGELDGVDVLNSPGVGELERTGILRWISNLVLRVLLEPFAPISLRLSSLLDWCLDKRETRSVPVPSSSCGWLSLRSLPNADDSSTAAATYLNEAFASGLLEVTSCSALSSRLIPTYTSLAQSSGGMKQLARNCVE